MSAATPAPSLERGTSDTARVGLTVVMPTLNEEAQIAVAVRDLAWVDDVIVIDGGSIDQTVMLAQHAGARVLLAPGVTIAGQRNVGIAAARHEWVLAVDADERVSTELRNELQAIVSAPRARHAAYRIRFRNYYLGRELRHGPWGRDWHVRLFSRERRFITSRVHERLEPVDDVGALSGAIVHTPYRDLAHHVGKIVQYARWGAEDARSRGRRARLWELSARPAWRFVRDYVIWSGWRDGTRGFIAAALSAFAAFLKYAFLFAMSAERGTERSMEAP